MTGTQKVVYNELSKLLNVVKEGLFGEGDDFDTDAFADEFNDDLLVLVYIHEGM